MCLKCKNKNKISNYMISACHWIFFSVLFSWFLIPFSLWARLWPYCIFFWFLFVPFIWFLHYTFAVVRFWNTGISMQSVSEARARNEPGCSRICLHEIQGRVSNLPKGNERCFFIWYKRKLRFLLSLNVKNCISGYVPSTLTG